MNVSFYKSKVDDKYLPRLEFRKENNDGELTKSRGNDVIIKFSDGEWSTTLNTIRILAEGLDEEPSKLPEFK